MAYIGSIPAYQASGVRPRDEFTADGTQICFPLSQSVPGSFESGVTIVLDNVPQQPVDAFTVIDTKTLTLTSITGTFTVNETVTGGTSTATGTVIKVNLGSIVIRPLTGTFSSSEGITGGSSGATATTTNVSINTGSGILFSEIPVSGSVIYVVHEGNATYNLVPTAASVGPTQLSDNLRNFTVDTFTGDGSTTAFTLSDTPSSANAILVMVDGIVQTRTTNYTLATNVVTFTGAPDSGSAITIIHLGFSTISRTGLVDGSVTTAKIADGSITAAKIADGTIIAADVAAGAITPAKLSTGGPTWDTSSNVGIGTASPSYKLDVQGATANQRIISTTGTNAAYQIFSNTGQNFYVGLDNSAGNQILSAGYGATFLGSGAYPMVFGTNNVERMRIFGDGRVSVNANATYDAGTTVSIGGGSTNVRATSAQLAITRATVSTQYEGINFNTGPSRACFIGRPPNSDDLIIGWDAGSALAEGLRFPSPGGGIKFPATQVASTDPNTLDDYEEGTWTPTLTFGGGTTGITYSTQSGTYVKIGRLVWLNCRVALTAKGSSTGSARITGIPFPGQGGSGGGEIQVGSVWYNSFINASNYHVNVRQDATNTGYMELRTYASGSEAQVNEGWFNNTSTFSFTMVYYTNQ